MMVELYKRVLERLGMPAELALCVEVLIFKENDDIRNYNCCRDLYMYKDYQMGVGKDFFE